MTNLTPNLTPQPFIPDDASAQDIGILFDNAVPSARRFAKNPTKNNLNEVTQFLKAVDDSDYIDEKASCITHHLLLLLIQLPFQDQKVFMKHFMALIDDTELYFHLMMKMTPITNIWRDVYQGQDHMMVP